MTSKRPQERRIARRIRDFDVSALLLLLAEIAPPGSPYALRRRGHPASTPQPAWLESIDFGPGDAPPAASVAANLGLMSCRSPLPDYLRGLALDPDVRDPLAELLSLLDDRLLERRFASYRPEGDPGVFPDWAGTKRDMLSLGALRSPAALCWLFQAIYPELRVTVERTPQDHSMPAPDARLGAAALGAAALSGWAVVPVRALEVRIACREHLSPLRDAKGVRRHWAAVALERLHAHVFPVLRGAGVHLTVWLLVLDEAARARIQGARSLEQSYLSYEPVRGKTRLHEVSRATTPPRYLPLRGALDALRRARKRRALLPLSPSRVRIFTGPIPEVDASR
jgi:hypothetical protein